MVAPEVFDELDDGRLPEERVPEDRVLPPEGRDEPAEEREPTLDDRERLGDDDLGDTVLLEPLRTEDDDPTPPDLEVVGLLPVRPEDRLPTYEVVGGTITGREPPVLPLVVLGVMSWRPPVVVDPERDNPPPEEPRPVDVFGRYKLGWESRVPERETIGDPAPAESRGDTVC